MSSKDIWEAYRDRELGPVRADGHRPNCKIKNMPIGERRYTLPWGMRRTSGGYYLERDYPASAAPMGTECLPIERTGKNQWRAFPPIEPGYADEWDDEESRRPGSLPCSASWAPGESETPKSLPGALSLAVLDGGELSISPDTGGLSVIEEGGG